MAIKGIPKTEKIWTTYNFSENEKYYITSKINNRDTYFLYKAVGDTVEKIAKHAKPNILYDKYIQPIYDQLTKKR